MSILWDLDSAGLDSEQRSAQRGKRASMNRRRASRFQRGHMGAGSVSLMPGKAVSRVSLRLLNHEPVSGHFGEDGSGGDAQAFAVPADNRLLRQGDILQPDPSINQQVAGGRLQLGQSNDHRQFSCRDDTHLIDLSGGAHANAVSRGIVDDDLVEVFTDLGGKLLGVVDFLQPGEPGLIQNGQDHCPSHYRAGN